ncbi:MAG: hypothetical protein HY665_08305 [Chloroflexi bacterium]|nr:hypothetical protein [Chloroflexota bacterium]
MKRIFAVAMVLVLVSVGDFGFGYMVSRPKIKNYETQVAQLTTEVTGLAETISDQETEILAYQSEKAGLESKLGEAQAETLASQKQVDKLKSDMAGLNAQISTSQNKLDKVMGVTMTQHFDWFYQGKLREWHLPVPLSLYVEYKDRTRPASAAYFIDLAKDPKDDGYIDTLVAQMNSLATQERLNELQKLNLVVTFIQSLPYTVDKETTPYDEYARYPIETLFDAGGDCEDTSILAAAILDRMGYDAAILLLRNARHMALGVSMAGASGSYYEYNGKKYYYVETTGDGWPVGQVPPGITDRTAQVYPVKG